MNDHEIELGIQDAQKKVELGKALNRLKGNADFNLLIGRNYFVDHAARVVSLLASPAMQKPDAQALLMGDLRAISELQQYFNMVDIEAAKAAQAIDEMNQMRIDAAAEGDE